MPHIGYNPRVPRRVVLVLPALTAALAASACITAPPKDQPLVKELRIEGTHQVSEGDIKDRILTTEPSFPWEFEVFDPNAWQADLRRIERYYETQGYFQARVVEDEIIPEDDSVRLRVRVLEGEPTRIAEIRIEGLDALTEPQRVIALQGFPLREGEIFKEDVWADVKPTLQSRLREMGYAEAVVDGTVEVDVDTHLARVLIQATPGQRYRFDEIFVATDANPKVPPKWIVEEARRAIAKGQWYSESALAEAQSRVFKMGVFGGVKVNRGAANRAAGTVPVVIDVREAPFRTIRYGFGIGIDPSRQEGRVLGEYVNRNFFGSLRQFSAKLRVGYAFIPSVIDVVFNNTAVTHFQDPLASLQLDFSQPRILLPSLKYFASLEGELRPEQAYAVVGGQAKTGVAWSPVPSLVGQLSYNFEAYHFTRGVAGIGGQRPLLAFGCDDDPCVLSFVEAQLEYDRRMRMTTAGLRPDPVDPARGYYLGLSLQAGGGPLGGSFQYVRITPEVRGYISFLENERLTLAARVRAGTLISEQESPIVSRFYVGGGTSMRGYGNRRLSPLLLVPPDVENGTLRCQSNDPDVDPCQTIAPVGRTIGDVVPIGGERMFEGSLEARYRFNEDFVFAAFFDTGFNNRADRLGNDITWSNAPAYFATWLQYAVGLGVRYVTLVGPIRVDLAYRLPFGTPPRVYELPGTSLVPPPGGGCFGLGETQRGPTVNPEGRCSLHISIGEAF